MIEYACETCRDLKIEEDHPSGCDRWCVSSEISSTPIAIEVMPIECAAHRPTQGNEAKRPKRYTTKK